MFELANWGTEILERANMSETIRIAGRECRFRSYGKQSVTICNSHDTLDKDGKWRHWSEVEDPSFTTEAAAREFARKHADAPTDQPAGAEASGCDGVSLIAAERQRQVSQEGWTPEHDDEHTLEELAQAAACYVMPDFARPGKSRPLTSDPSVEIFVPDLWPWDAEWWKPGDRIRELAKAGALIAAEIDRLLRARGNWHPAPASELADLRAEVERLREDLAAQKGISRGAVKACITALNEAEKLRTQLAAVERKTKDVLADWDSLHSVYDAIWDVCVECGMEVTSPGVDADGNEIPGESAYMFKFLRDLKAKADSCSQDTKGKE